MSFSPIIRVRKLLDKMKSEREGSPKLKRFPSRTLSQTDSPSSSPSFVHRKYLKVEDTRDCGDITVLPNEAILHIFSFLEAKDISCLRTVSKEWYDFAEDNLIWKRLCEYDFNVHQLVGENWRTTYYRLEQLFADGVWEGISKWVEPDGFDNEQKTTARLHFLKRNEIPNSNITKSFTSSPSIRRTTSAILSSPTTSSQMEEKSKSATDKSSPYKVIGSGVTINCSSPSPFKIEGDRPIEDVTGASFQWSKCFERHTSIYKGSMDFVAGTVSGTITYFDGTTHWRGEFCYSKINSKRTNKKRYDSMFINA